MSLAEIAFVKARTCFGHIVCPPYQSFEVYSDRLNLSMASAADWGDS